MFGYGTMQHHDVPGPEVHITVSSPKEEQFNSEVKALIDTGAVMTCIPEKAITELDRSNLEYGTRKIRGATGQQREMTTYIVNVRIGGCEFSDIEVVALDREYALIGRDILNGYRLAFDGPNRTWRVDKNANHRVP